MYINGIIDHFVVLGYMGKLFVDDLFDFEIQSGAGVKYGITAGIVKAEFSYVMDYISYNEHFKEKYGHDEYGIKLSYVNNKHMAIGIDYNHDEGYKVIYPVFNNVEMQTGKDFKLSFGASASLLLIPQFGSISFDINIGKVSDKDYLDNLIRRAIRMKEGHSCY